MPVSENEFSAPVRNGFSHDKKEEKNHKLNWKELEEYLENPKFGSTKIANAAIGHAHIQDASIDNAQIIDLSVDKLTSGNLTANVGLIGTITAGDPSSGHVTMDVNGILVNNGTDDTVQIFTAGDATFKGILTALGLTVDGMASFRSETSFELESVTTLHSSVSNPPSAPLAAWFYETLDLESGAIDTRRGLKYASAFNQYISTSRSGTIEAWDDTTGAINWTIEPLSSGQGYQMAGAVIVSGDLFAVGKWDSNNRWYLLRYQLDISGEPQSVAAPTERISLDATIQGSDDVAGICYNGSTLQVAWLADSTRRFRRTTVSTSMVVGANTDIENPLGTNVTPYDIEYHSESSATYWIAMTTATGPKIQAYNNSSSHISAADFVTVDQVRGVTHNGTVFVTTDQNTPSLQLHTNWTSAQTKIHVAYAWYDTGGSDESLVSPQTILDHTPRANLRISTDSLPVGVDAIRVYALENNSTSTVAAGGLKLQVQVSASPAEISSYDGGGAADQTVNGFASGGTPATLKTELQGMHIDGDGTFVVPIFTTNPSSPVKGQIWFNDTTDKFMGFDGSTNVALN